MKNHYPILGLLQNPWAYDPETAQALMNEGHEHRRRWIMNAMPKSPTGRRLRRSLGDSLFHLIVWDNGDPTVSSSPSYQAKPDHFHVARLIGHYRPKLIICYGKVAQATLVGQRFQGVIITCCHPTYRNVLTVSQLTEAAQSVKMWLSQAGYYDPSDDIEWSDKE